MISLLLAMDRNRVIGKDNDLPWSLPKDLRFFKEKTTGNTIIMGRKTYESMGGALPNRRNVVLTSKQFLDGVETIQDVQTIVEWNDKEPQTEFFVIGGGKLFKEALSFADRLYITWIDETFEGDTYFPTFDETEWEITSKVKGEKNEKNPYDYYFIQYDRILHA